MTRAVRLAARVDARAESRVANQLLGGGKARDVADCREDRHRDDDAEPRQLHQVRHLLRPRRDHTQAIQFIVHLGNLGFEMVERREVLANPQFFRGRHLQPEPPRAIFRCGEKFALGWREIVAVNHAVEPIARHRPHLDEPSAMR